MGVRRVAAVAVVALAACGDQVQPALPDAGCPAVAACRDDRAHDGLLWAPDAGGPGDACIPRGAGAEVRSIGEPGRLLLRGVVVAPDGPFFGEVLIDGDRITCVATSCQMQPLPAPTVIDTHGIIFPGLVDAHNHVLYDIFDGSHWAPAQLYTNHDDWPREARYAAMVDAKQYLNGEAGSPVNIGCELDKYGELKGLIAGTTSIQGSATPANRICYGSLARTIDQGPNDLDDDRIQTATLFPSVDSADGVCENFGDGSTAAYVVHVGEGTDDGARGELAELGAVTTVPECLYAPQTAIVHGTAFGADEMAVLAAHQMSLIWSPRSNVFLYGGGTDLSQTTDIPLALAAGLNVALAPDWSIGGSPNLLDELRFADEVDAAVWGDILTPRDLFEMATIRAARALGLASELGELAVGKKADLFVIQGNPADPYAALLAAHPVDVRLVVVGGAPLYGDASLAAITGERLCETLDVCCAEKFLCVAEADGATAANKLGQTYAEIATAIATELAAYDALDVSTWDFSPIAPLVSCPAGPP